MSYWETRNEELYKAGEMQVNEYFKKLEKAFNQTKRELQKTVESFYWRYAEENGLTYAAAQKQLDKAEIRGLREFVELSMQNIGKYNQEVNNMSIKARMTRYQALEAQVDAMLRQLYAVDYQAAAEKTMQEVYADTYNRTWYNIDQYRGFHSAFAQVNPHSVEKLLEYPFNGANFSDRLWKQKDHLQTVLMESITTMMVQGVPPQNLAKDFAKKMQSKKFDAYRLLHTESSFLMGQATHAGYIEDGVEKYQILSTLDSKTCGICGEQDGKVYPVKDAVVGKNMWPFHPFCRCCDTAYYDDEDLSDQTRAARNPETRKTYEVPADMTYPEWKKVVDGDGDFDKWKAERDKKRDDQKRYAARREEWKKRHSEQSFTPDSKSDELTERRKARLEARRRRQKAELEVPDFTSMNRDALIEYANKNLKTKFEETKGAGEEYLREAVKVIDAFEKRMGGKTLEGLSVKFGSTGNGVYAKYDDKTKTVLLKKTGNIKAFEESQKSANLRYRHKWKTDKDYYATETFSGTLWHELGHAVDVDTGQALSRKLSADSNLDAMSVRVSSYAGTSQNIRVAKRSEAWAENFAAYMDGGRNKGSVPEQISDMIEEYFKGKSIEKTSGSGILDVAEEIHRSVGAKSRNYDVYNPKTGEIMHLTEGTRIIQPKNHIMAGNGRDRQIDCIDWLNAKYPEADPNEWTKEKGFGYVTDEYGDERKVELHWYQNPKTGKVEMKIKPGAGGEWFIEDD